MADATVFFATNRKPNDAQNPTDFTEEIVGDGDSIRFGRADFSGVELGPEPDGDTDKVLTALGASAKIYVAPETLDATDAAKSVLGSREILALVHQSMADNGLDALFYVHGYDFTFRQSIARAAQLQAWYGGSDDGLPLLVCVFAWPSLGKAISPATYRDERTRAQLSGPAMGRAILKAVDYVRGIATDRRCGQRVHLLAHSMGNWALRSAVQSMRTFVGDNIPPLFDQVMLMAADEDDDTLSLSYKLQPILRGCRRVSVYCNRYDWALKASHTVMGNPDRLGAAGPADLKSLPDKVAVISVASVLDTNVDGEQHQYYRMNAATRRDLLAVMRGAADHEIKWRAQENGLYVLTPMP